MKKILSLVLALAVLTVLLSSCGGGDKSIVVGAKDFTEQDVLGNIVTI